MQCPHCNHELRIPAKFAGQEVACNFCRGMFIVPAAPPQPVMSVATMPSTSPPQLPPSAVQHTQSLFDTNCPACEKELRIPEHFANKYVTCKFCHHMFKAPAPTDDQAEYGPMIRLGAEEMRPRIERFHTTNGAEVVISFSREADALDMEQAMLETLKHLRNAMHSRV